MGKNKRLYVIDTNVLMHDPTSLFRFEEHDVFLHMMVLDELDADHEAAAAHLADAWVAGLDLRQRVHYVLPNLSCILHVLFFDQVDRRQCCRTGHQVAPATHARLKLDRHRAST